jgi:hypothetical protein
MTTDPAHSYMDRIQQNFPDARITIRRYDQPRQFITVELSDHQWNERPVRVEFADDIRYIPDDMLAYNTHWPTPETVLEAIYHLLQKERPNFHKVTSE